MITISLKFVPNGTINNMPELVQIMVCRLIGTKPLSEPLLAYCSEPMFTDTYMRHSDSMSYTDGLFKVQSLYFIAFRPLALTCVHLQTKPRQ